MTLPMRGNDSKTRSEYASLAVNRVIKTIIDKSLTPKNRAFVSIIGYNQDVNEIASGYIQDLAASPKRIERKRILQPDGAGGMVNVDVETPIWVEKDTNGGDANMKEAFDAAYELTKSWIKDHKNSPAPIILNISDGNPYWEKFSKEECIQKTVEAVKAIRTLKTSDGNVLVYNVFLDETFKTSFPLYEDEMESKAGRFLYNISSIVPITYIDCMHIYDVEIRFGARACLTDTDALLMIGNQFDHVIF